MLKKCNHRRKRKNYPYGKKSKPIVVCKDCGQRLTSLQLRKMKTEEKRKSKSKRRKNVKN